jgi:diguanylate cyclase (GGDEF)-like protein
MVRAGVDDGVRGGRARRRRKVASAPVRIILMMAAAAVPAGVVGGRDGFWLCIPLVLLAAAVASTPVGAFCCALPVLAAGALAAAAVHRGPLPPVWLILVVPGACAAVLQSVSGRLRQERDSLQHAAFRDPLTGLANRRMLLSTAQYEIARHHRNKARFVVMMIDLDGFKLLNDRYGHAAGDQLLRDVAEALTATLRRQDTIARIGGDEFCVIAPETENSRALAEKVTYAVAHAAAGIEGLQTSVGVSAFPADGTTIEPLMRAADDRLLAAKRSRYSRTQPRAA